LPERGEGGGKNSIVEGGRKGTGFRGSEKGWLPALWYRGRKLMTVVRQVENRSRFSRRGGGKKGREFQLTRLEPRRGGGSIQKKKGCVDVLGTVGKKKILKKREEDWGGKREGGSFRAEVNLKRGAKSSKQSRPMRATTLSVGKGDKSDLGEGRSLQPVKGKGSSSQAEKLPLREGKSK